MEGQKSDQVVYTNKARCRDCYRCVRVCPVKAIKLQKGQAFVVEERCISCGTCIKECPQQAKCFRNDLELASRLVSERKGHLVASIAPSFASLFSPWEQERLPSALRQLGFTFVAETAVGAFQVAKETAALLSAQPERSHVCSACPAVVRYIESYEPDKAEHLTPVVSPMIAHAKHLKEKLGENSKVIFFGPCVAKKAEAEWPQNAGWVDCVLTFTEMLAWFEKEGIELFKFEASRFDELPEGESRYFPLAGGLVRTAALNTDLLADEVLAVSGFGEVREALQNLDVPRIVEPLFCHQGCINGPGIPTDKSLFKRRQDVLSYAAAHPGALNEGEEKKGLAIAFNPKRVDGERPVSEEEIRQVLERSGNAKPEDQLNCGACGYNSCRDKAIAVLHGMAEVEMCIPSMRRMAEQRSDLILETSPNGILILDERLNIIGMNPAFRRFFMCSEGVYGRRISYLMDPEPFERLAASGEDLLELTMEHERYHHVFHQFLYPLRESSQYAGIFVNITDSRANQEKLERMKGETIKQAKELLDHQIWMAQGIAKFLGESTAQSEQLVQNILNLAGDNRA